MKKYILALTCILVTCTLSAQEFSGITPDDAKPDDPNYGYFNYAQVLIHRGQHPSGTNYLQDVFSNGFWAGTFRIGAQATGRKEWQRLHNYPQYGLGVAFFDLGGAEADSAIGAPSSLFFYFGAPWARLGKLTFSTDLEVGLAYDFKPWDPVTNQFQDVIGASANLHFCMNFLFTYQLTERMDLNLGWALTHFSNGRSFTPQKGVNLMGFNIGTAYHFNPIKNYTKYNDPDYQPKVRPEFVVAEKSPFYPKHEFHLTPTVGTVLSEPGDYKDENGARVSETYQKRYITSTISAEYAYHFARKLKGVTGIDYFYDGSAEYLYPDLLPQDTKFKHKSMLGWHLGFHYLIERFTFVYNWGTYLYTTDELVANRGNWYMRVGGNIGITETFDIHILLKTRNGGIADWIEWGITKKFEL